MSWVKAIETISGLKCIANEYNETDLVLVGKYGFIWQTGPEKFKALVTNYKLYNRLAMAFGIRYAAIKGDENFINFEPSQLKEMVKELKIGATQAAQIKLMNRFDDPNRIRA